MDLTELGIDKASGRGKITIVKDRNEECKNLRFYQEESIRRIESIAKKADDGNFSTVLVMPTGAGKTVTMVTYILRNAIRHRDKVLWLAHRSFLLEQAYRTFYCQSCTEIVKGEREGSYSTYIATSGYGKLANIEPESEVVFATTQAFAKVSKEDSNLRDSVDKWLLDAEARNKRVYIVYDEVHHIGAEVYGEIFQYLFSKQIPRYALIGCTATYYREGNNVSFYQWFKDGFREGESYAMGENPEEKLRKRLEERYEKGGQPVYGLNRLNNSKWDIKDDINEENMVSVIEIQDLFNLGHLIEPKLYRIDEFFELDFQEEKERIIEDLCRKILYEKGAKEDKLGKTIVFADTQDTANSVKTRLNHLGYQKCEVCISSETDGESNADILEKFAKTNETDILVVVNILNEGYDLPELNTVILLETGNSRVRLQQRIGRVLRSGTGRGKKDANVIWYYFEKRSNGGGELNKPDDLHKTHTEGFFSVGYQDEESQRNDMERSTYYLTAPEYKERLKPKRDEVAKERRVYQDLLNILAYFKSGNSREAIKYCIGFYRLHSDREGDFNLYVDEMLNECLKQLYRELRTIYLWGRRKGNNPANQDNKLAEYRCINFEEYCQYCKNHCRGMEGSGDDAVLDYIKKVYFFKCSPKANSTFLITDAQIKAFINFVLSNEAQMPTLEGEALVIYEKIEEYIKEHPGKLPEECPEELINEVEQELCNKESENLGEGEQSVYDNKEVRAELQSIIEKVWNKKKNDHDREREQDKKKMKESVQQEEKEYKEKGRTAEEDIETKIAIKKAIEEAIKKRKEAIQEQYKTEVKRKEHAKDLVIQNKLIYEEIADLRNLVKNHRYKNPKPVCPNNSNVPVYRIVLEDTENTAASYYPGKKDQPWDFEPIVFANAVIENSHHVVVTEKDIKNFGELLKDLISKKEVLQGEVFDDQLDNLVRDIIFELHHMRSDVELASYITQFRKNTSKIPEILVIYAYDWIYNYLFQEELPVFYKEEGGHIRPSNYCQNIRDLRKKYKEALKGYGLNESDMEKLGLDVVRDLIEDYRPYRKVIQHYLGIKPDLLTRMMNFILRQESGKADTILDGCGGSGAAMMNRFHEPEIFSKEVYNEVGSMHTSFYSVLKNKGKLDQLKQMVKAIISYILDPDKKENSLYQQLLDKFKSVKDDSDSQQKDNDATNSKDKTQELANKYPIFFQLSLTKDEGGYMNKLHELVRKKEAILHKVWEKCNEIFLFYQNISHESKLRCISEVEQAFVFFIANSFSSRQKFDDCYLINFINFAAQYEDWLDLGAERVCHGNENMGKECGVKITRKDVNELIKEYKDNREVILYADIPYVGTSDVSYSKNAQDAQDSKSSEDSKDGFDAMAFSDNLKHYNGKYIISSRYNVICTGEQEEQEKKKRHIEKFFESFSKEKKEDKAARYIVMPYTNVELVKNIDPNRRREFTKVRNNYSLNMKDVLQMLRRTVDKDSKVEVMITNIEFEHKNDKKLLDFYKLDEEGGVRAYPTIIPQGSGAYSAEPIYLVLEYGKFLKLREMVIEGKEERTKKIARIFQAYVKRRDREASANKDEVEGSITPE